MNFKMNPEVKDKWINALRGGEYVQTTGCLRDSYGFCCLGVLTDIYLKEHNKTWSGGTLPGSAYTYDGECAMLPKEVMNWAGLGENIGAAMNHNNNIRDLPDLNDEDQLSFFQLSDLIEKQL